MSEVIVTTKAELQALLLETVNRAIDQKITRPRRWMPIDEFVADNPTLSRDQVQRWHRSQAIKTKTVGRLILIDMHDYNEDRTF